jgi:hypothetical protein
VRGFVNNNPKFNFPIEEVQETERKDKKTHNKIKGQEQNQTLHVLPG